MELTGTGVKLFPDWDGIVETGVWVGAAIAVGVWAGTVAIAGARVGVAAGRDVAIGASVGGGGKLSAVVRVDVGSLDEGFGARQAARQSDVKRERSM